MVTPGDIVGFASGFLGSEVRCAEDGDLLAEMQIDGAEAKAFFESYASHFAVDAASLAGHFHYKSEGSQFWRRERPVGQDGRTFSMIPITPQLLSDAANEGRWVLEYPSHRVHVSRWPMVLMFFLLATLVLSVTVLVARATM